MSNYYHPSDQSPEPLGRRKIFGIALLSFILIVGVATSWWGLSKVLSSGAPAETATPSTSPTAPGQSPTAGITPVPTKEASDERWAFLLLGYGGGGHEGGYLTDSIIVAIMDPAKKTATLLSIPRDSWVPLMLNGRDPMYDKVNAAYAYGKDPDNYPNRLPEYEGSAGGGKFAKDTISRLLGIPITNFLALDFQGFREMIDTVGGIEVEVPNSFTANYPRNDDPTIDPGWTTVTFTAGKEKMNGERAIQFARAREVIDNWQEGTDFARSHRQRLIMESFKNRMFEPGGIIHMPQILGIAKDHMDTDYGITDVGQVSQFVMNWKDVKFYQTAISTSNYLTDGTGPGGAYILAPTTPDLSWSQIRAFAKLLWEDPACGEQMAKTKITIINNSGQPGLADHVGEALISRGYQVKATETGVTTAGSRLIDRTGGKAETLIAKLQKDLGLKMTPSPDASYSGDPEIILEIGYDDVKLANLAILQDDDAPLSDYGVTVVGGWSPAQETATPEETYTPEATQTSGSEAEGEATGVPTPSGGDGGNTGVPLPASTPTPRNTTTPEPGPAETATPKAVVTPESTPEQPPSATPTMVPWPTPVETE